MMGVAFDGKDSITTKTVVKSGIYLLLSVFHWVDFLVRDILSVSYQVEFLSLPVLETRHLVTITSVSI